MNVTTVKSTTDRLVQETTIKRTLAGESADLQIRSRTDNDGNVELLHVHCGMGIFTCRSGIVNVWLIGMWVIVSPGAY